MQFTLRQLEYFVATCDVGSVTKAAINIPVAQSSVSAAISQLEAALGVQLLIRHHAQGVSPTPAGRKFLAHARALLREADQLERFASELTEELSGTLELGCLATIAPLALPGLCQTFQTKHPGVRFELTSASHRDLVDSLRTGQLTMALTYDLDITDDLAFEPLASLPPYALFATDHQWADREEITLSELAQEPLVLLDLPVSRDYFRELFIAAGLEPNVAQRSPHREVVCTLVANGFGYTILNARALNDRALDGRPLSSVPIAAPARALIMGLTTLSDIKLTRLSTAFVDHCRDAVKLGKVPALLPNDAVAVMASAQITAVSRGRDRRVSALG